MPSRQLSVAFDSATEASIAAEASERGVSKAFVVREIVTKHYAGAARPALWPTLKTPPTNPPFMP